MLTASNSPGLFFSANTASMCKRINENIIEEGTNKQGNKQTNEQTNEQNYRNEENNENKSFWQDVWNLILVI